LANHFRNKCSRPICKRKHVANDRVGTVFMLVQQNLHVSLMTRNQLQLVVEVYLRSFPGHKL